VCVCVCVCARACVFEYMNVKVNAYTCSFACSAQVCAPARADAPVDVGAMHCPLWICAGHACADSAAATAAVRRQGIQVRCVDANTTRHAGALCRCVHDKACRCAV